MAFQLRHIEETLERPDAIRESKSDQSVTLYYRLYDDRQGRERHLCLVVKRDEDRSFILTGYLTRRISGDRQ